MLQFTGERIVPGASNCEPTFAAKMYQEHIARYEFAATLAPGAAVLDIGCGVGYGSQHLARRGAKSVVAIDIAPDAVAHAQANFAHPVVRFECRSALELDLPAQFDLVTCFEVIEHITADEQIELLDVIRHCLKPDGVLVCSTPRPYKTMRSDFHVHELEFDELSDMLNVRFRTVRSFFEGNYFTSYVGVQEPKMLDRVIPVTDRFGPESADYYLFLGTNGGPSRLNKVGPLIVMNDDAYVLGLERDVDILHRAEDDAKQRIKDMEEEVRNVAPGDPDLLAILRRQPAEAAAARAIAESKLSGISEALKTLNEMYANTAAFAASAQDALISLRRDLEAMRQRAESAEASHRHELGQAQMLHEVLFQHSEALKAATIRADTAEANHAHELGQAQLLHRVLAEHAEAVSATKARADTAEVLHAHELGQAQMLHCMLTERSDALNATTKRLEEADAALAHTTELLRIAEAEKAEDDARLRGWRAWGWTAPLRRVSASRNKAVRVELDNGN